MIVYVTKIYTFHPFCHYLCILLCNFRGKVHNIRILHAYGAGGGLIYEWPLYHPFPSTDFEMKDHFIQASLLDKFKADALFHGRK